MVAHPGEKSKKKQEGNLQPHRNTFTHPGDFCDIMYPFREGVAKNMGKWKNKLIAFMYGRYGVDALYYGLSVVWMALWIAGTVTESPVLYILAWLCLGYTTFRMFSKNIARRRRENEWFLKFWNPTKNFFRFQWRRIKECREAVYRKCPDCRSNLRLPHRRGKHTAVCPRCGRRFDVHIWF